MYGEGITVAEVDTSPTLSLNVRHRQIISLDITHFIMDIYTRLIFPILSSFRYRLRHAYETDLWDAARKTVAAIWDAHGWIWHGSNLFHTSNYWRQY